jgi:hypothetical protein
MNSTLLSVCLCGAGLCTAAIMLMQHPTCSSGGAMVAMVDRDVPSTKTEVVRTVEASPKAAVQIPTPPKPTKKPRVPTPKDVNVTGSVKPTPKNNQGRYAQAESKILDKSNHKAPAHKPRSYGRYQWESYPYPWPPAAYPYPWPPAAFAMDEYPDGW